MPLASHVVDGGDRNEPAMTIRVVLADDQPLVRGGLALLLAQQPDLQVIAEVGSGTEAVAVARAQRPDVVVMDVRMPGLDGVAATRLVANAQTEADRPVRVLILTTFKEDDLVHEALRAGASGFLLKEAAVDDLPKAIRHVANGDAWLDPKVARAVIGEVAAAARPPGDGASVLERLTPREREILGLMAEGLSNEQIAARFVLSVATVKTHVTRILMKTDSHARTEAVVLAYRCGLVAHAAARDTGRSR